MSTQAIRNTYSRKVHLDTGQRTYWRGSTTAITQCGQYIEQFGVLPWVQTAPEDRCKRCAKRAPIEPAPAQAPIEEEQA